MFFEVSREQFEAACRGYAAGAVIHAAFTVVGKAVVRRSESAPPKGSAPGTAAETRVFDEEVPEHVGRVVVVTAGGETVYQPTEPFDAAFVRKLLPAAVVVGSILG